MEYKYYILVAAIVLAVAYFMYYRKETFGTPIVMEDMMLEGEKKALLQSQWEPIIVEMQKITNGKDRELYWAKEFEKITGRKSWFWHKHNK